MADSEVQSLERAVRFGHRFANVSVHPSGEQVSVPVQRRQVTDDQQLSSAEQRPNHTGSPDRLKAGNAVVQRQIYWVPATNQFQIDNVRPNWTGAAALMALGPNQDRAHIVAFEVIQNDLANILNDLVQGYNAAKANRLVALTDALYPALVPAAEVAHMQGLRQQLLNDIQNGNAANYHARAQALLAVLNSATPNLRAGHHGLNASIGYSIDAEFNAGSTPFQGWVRTDQDLLLRLIRGPIQVLTLTPHSNAIVYNYQRQSTLAMSFVVNGLHGAAYPGVPQGQQLSSTQGPTIVPATMGVPSLPVLVTDPAGVGLPYLYR